MWKDCETELDFLDFNYLIKILEDTVNDQNLLPSSIGVYGDWGSGKSSLMNMCKKELENQEDTVCLLFNGWLFEGYEDAKTAVLGSILDGISENRKLLETAEIILKALYESIDKFKLIKDGLKFGADLILTGGLGTMADFTIQNIVNKVTEKAEDVDVEKTTKIIKDKLNNRDLREDIKSFRKKFAKLLNESGIKKLIVFIDELDRCNPNTILDTLEAMRLFLFIGNVSFVIGADERHISYAVKNKFKDIEGLQFDIGKEYLEKLIQYPIRIPRLDVNETKFYIMCLLFQHKLDKENFDGLLEYLNNEKKKDFLKFKVDYSIVERYNKEIAEIIKDDILVANQLAPILTKGLNGNPRQCKRFLNTLDMRLRMAEYKEITLNIKILAKIMELEYFRSQLFKKMAQLWSENKLEKELGYFEDGKVDQLKELSVWKDDQWVKEWINSGPLLSSEDLSMYFYFTRTSLDNKSMINEIKMSEQANKFYQGLIKGSETILKRAVKAIDEFTEFDTQQILEGLYNNLIQDEEINNTKLKIFLGWGQAKKELKITTIEYLKGISGMRILKTMIPLIQGFYENLENKDTFREVLVKWKKENIEIKAEINEVLGDE